MISGRRYLTLTATRTRAPLLPLAATAFAVIGTFYLARSPVNSTWALTAVLAAGLAAWLTVAVLTAEPPSQADIATAALGGVGARTRLTATLACLLAVGLAILFVAYPLLLDLLVSGPVFDRPARIVDVLAALVTNATSAAVGGAVGILCSPPRIARRATSAAAALALLLLLVAVGAVLGPFAGPMSAAVALSDAPRAGITAGEVAGWASCVVLFGLLMLVVTRLDRRRA